MTETHAGQMWICAQYMQTTDISGTPVCEAISDAGIRAAVEAHLIDPRLQMRTWEYGENAIHPVWLIADTGAHRAGIAYSEYGHGPLDPWGLVFFDEDIFGMDSLWHKNLESLVLNLRVWNFTAPLGSGSSVAELPLNSVPRLAHFWNLAPCEGDFYPGWERYVGLS